MTIEKIADGLYHHKNRVVYFTSLGGNLYLGKFINGSDCIGSLAKTGDIVKDLWCSSRLMASDEPCRGMNWSAEVSINIPDRLDYVEGIISYEPKIEFYGKFVDQITQYASKLAGREVNEVEASQMILNKEFKLVIVSCDIIREDERTIAYSNRGKVFMRHFKHHCQYGELPSEDIRISDAKEVYEWVKEHSFEVLSTKVSLLDIISNALRQPGEIKVAWDRAINRGR